MLKDTAKGKERDVLTKTSMLYALGRGTDESKKLQGDNIQWVRMGNHGKGDIWWKEKRQGIKPWLQSVNEQGAKRDKGDHLIRRRRKGAKQRNTLGKMNQQMTVNCSLKDHIEPAKKQRYEICERGRRTRQETNRTRKNLMGQMSGKLRGPGEENASHRKRREKNGTSDKNQPDEFIKINACLMK